MRHFLTAALAAALSLGAALAPMSARAAEGVIYEFAGEYEILPQYHAAAQANGFDTKGKISFTLEIAFPTHQANSQPQRMTQMHYEATGGALEVFGAQSDLGLLTPDNTFTVYDDHSYGAGSAPFDGFSFFLNPRYISGRPFGTVEHIVIGNTNLHAGELSDLAPILDGNAMAGSLEHTSFSALTINFTPPGASMMSTIGGVFNDVSITAVHIPN